MAHPLNIIEIPALIPKKMMKKVVFADSGISIEKSIKREPSLFIPCENISSFRFGIEGMHFFKLTFCRQYFIEIKDYENKIFRIKLSSYYGINQKIFFKVWAELLEHFWSFYMVNQLNFYTELFEIGQPFELSGVTFYPDGISWDNNRLKWSEVAVSSYQTHFNIHHINDPSQYKCCVFSIHWNAVVLQTLLNDIIKHPVKMRKPSWL
jgi:hypothetical protein